jgi:signal transduction histidine kinase
MFRVESTKTGANYRLAVIGLLLLSGAALAITIWVMVDFLREQSIVEELTAKLPSEARESAEVLAVELRWQFRLSILVVLNLVAVVLLWRAYRTSQDTLRDIKALASDVIGSMDQAVITVDLAGKVTSINRRGMELLELNSDCVGRPVKELAAVPLDQFLTDWLVQRSVAMIRDFPTSHNGNARTLRAFCQMLSDHEGKDVGNVLQLRDVTDRVLIEDRMRRMERYMGLGSLAGGLHHEIKNPLAALSLHVQLLEEELESGETSIAVRQMLGVIRTEVTRIGGVLEGFRDFASIEQLNPASVNITDLIVQQVDLLRPTAKQQAVELVFDSSRAIPEILVDRIRLEQVLLNLIVNAIESMPAGGVLTISTSASDDQVVIEVADTGCGIPVNLQDKILDPYFTTKSEGTGLGLALCDKIMRQHYGSLEFRSSPAGTTFRLTLPRSNALHINGK